jgi:hypothetical protein
MQNVCSFVNHKNENSHSVLSGIIGTNFAVLFYLEGSEALILLHFLTQRLQGREQQSPKKTGKNTLHNPVYPTLLFVIFCAFCIRLHNSVLSHVGEG